MIRNNIVVRKAINIKEKNNIANFAEMYFSPFSSASAISFELLNMESSTGKYCLLKKFLSCNYPSETRLEFVIQISNQLNKESLKYKGI